MPLSKFEAHAPTFLRDCERFLLELESDERVVMVSAAKSELTIDLDALKKDPEVSIRKAFPFDNERIVKPSERASYFLSHYFMALFVLRDMILPGVKELAETLKQQVEPLKEPFSWKQIDEMKIALEQMDRLGSYCANLLDVWEEYEIYLGESCALLDKDRAYERPMRYVSDVAEFEFTGAAWSVLLSRPAGRHAPVPLIRSAIEVGVNRLVLDPDHTETYRDKILVETRRLNPDKIADASRTKGVPIVYGHESLKRIYAWASRFVHMGERYPHEELWFALRYAESLRQGFVVAASTEEARKHYDALVSELQRRGAIEVLEKAGSQPAPQ